ncbi:MAG: hypothetical protein B7X08_02365 [Acidocella sp. 20-63-7]|nr:MAG: hypothetical protein B7X08_02365 [Acidocella sp. 20-63-7]HQT46247.1 glycosyltransferase [Acidocella sp.]
MRGEDDTSPRLIAGQRPTLDAYDADIIILALNRLLETTEAIKSALSQRGLAFHVTILDQGSEPETLDVLTRTFAKTRNLALYASPKNFGVAGGRNLATALGHGQIILALDNDATFSHAWIAARACRAFRYNPALGALGFGILAADGLTPDKSSWGYPERLLPRFGERFDTTTFVGAGHAIRRITWGAAGGYDPSFFFTWEEYDFCLKAIALNWRIEYDGSLTIRHKVSPDARIGWDAARMTHFVRNRLLIGRKWGASWLGLAPRMLGYLVKAMRNGCFPAALEGIAAAFQAAPPQRRRMTPAMRHYLYLNETRYRGSWPERLRREVLGHLKTSP